MNKTELIANVAEMSEITKKDAEKVVKAMFECISETLAKGEKVQIIGFGTFEVRERKAREGPNPSNPKQKIKIPASKSPAFKAGKQLKERVNVKPAKKARRK
ncbi:MAG: HU family DNA-binding protein [Negativicoccus succinicivorans]|uniref:HU family DNA-binding protein n=1 Tax=Negativicoccus succinicivorans TaxID=620903 RepID=UPI00290CA972|nr:HU family DNA-binding protein [Negativicoccus succinicivorans]MDU5915019.1 HU family DNA-binding protein [Negativicoccus succinicivorans]